MSIVGSEQWMYSAGREFYDFPIEQSLRFNDDDSAYLSRAGISTGNRKTWTWSGWVKRGNLAGAVQYIASAYYATSNGRYNLIRFDDNNALNVWTNAYNTSTSTTQQNTTSAVFRDVGAWYHIVVSVDTTQATASDRLKIYVNGVSQSYTGNSLSLNQDTFWNGSDTTYKIGGFSSSSYLDGYMAEVNFIDGQALDPTSFGEFKSGIWTPKDTAGLTFGTNGFRLQFGDTTEASGFNAVTYTGNGSSQSISGVGFSSSPDLVWVKQRDGTEQHQLFDTVRGAPLSLSSSGTFTENNNAQRLQSFDADGFTLGNDIAVNQSAKTYVAWTWDAGSGSAASNTDGSITSTVKANNDYGFSIASFTGASTQGATFGHGLDTAPSMVIAKARTGAQNWFVYHSALGYTKSVFLNLTNASATDNNTWRADPTSSLVTIGDNFTSSNDYIAYCLAEKTGFSRFSSYSGTGAAGNSITGLGFAPAFVMIKRSDSGSEWAMYDNTRQTSNPKYQIRANASDAENSNSAVYVDLDSDGFTIQTTDAAQNASGGTYIYMAFADTRDAAFWRDTSGQGNDWQPNNLVFSDVVPDSATNNFAVLAPVNNPTDVYAEGRLKFQGLTSATSPYSTSVLGTFGVSSGKWYYEARANTRSNGVTIGFAREGLMPADGSIPSYKVFAFNIFDNIVTTNNSNTNDFTVTGAAGDILGLAIDIDNGTASAYINGTLKGSVTGLNTSGYQNLPYATLGWASGGQTMTMNFGQDSTFAGLEAAGGNADENGYGDFAYAPPSGYLSLCSANLPSGAIDTLNDETPEDYFNTVLFSATAGVAGSVTGYGFAPDWLWTKARNTTQSHQTFDNVRGDNKILYTNLTNAESTQAAGYFTLEEDGFDYGTSTFSSNTYVGWGWKANGTGVSNTDGSITSTVSVGATSQQNWFSIVGYQGNGSAGATVGHGLGVTPSMLLVKDRSATNNWQVFTETTGNTAALFLNLTAGVDSGETTYWNNTSPTSSVFSIGTNTKVNTSGRDYICYAFANAEGLCKVGSYVGNGSSTDGTFVYTGFRPSFLLIKRTDAVDNWPIEDNERNPSNLNRNYLLADTNGAEGTVDLRDFLSNGFKMRGSAQNASGGNYIYLAIAEQPFKYANAR